MIPVARTFLVLHLYELANEYRDTHQSILRESQLIYRTADMTPLGCDQG